jgi:ABC-type phosphate transport system substrate-binding protein
LVRAIIAQRETRARRVTLVIYSAKTGAVYNFATVTSGRMLLTLVLVVGVSCCVQAKQLAIVTDQANATTNLSAAELVKIFNAHSRTWADGKTITVVMRDPSSAGMQLVLHKLLNMTPDQARSFIQAHRDAIMIADSDDAVLRSVSITRGAIGVVDLYSLTKDVNVLKIDGKLPVEQGYLLKGN